MSSGQPDQAKFYSVYRGRHRGIFHLAYMRSSKVKAIRYILERHGITLRERSILDYGFGTGTFLRSCDTTCRIAGVEVDPENVAAVRTMLARRGHVVGDLHVLDVAQWSEHPLLASDRQYDIVVFSHVLEHVDDPMALLRHIRRNLAPTGVIVGLLPINELHPDENHKLTCDRSLVERWAAEAGFKVAAYTELDHWVYYAQPIFHSSGPLGRVIAQGISLLLGILQMPFTPGTWFNLGKGCRLLGAKPGQIAFLYAIR